jgi:hypothetical protein
MQKRNKIILAVALILALAMLLLVYSRRNVGSIQSPVSDLPSNAPVMAFPDGSVAPLQLTMNRGSYNPGANPPINFGAPTPRNNSTGGGGCCKNCTGNANGNPFSTGILDAYLRAAMSPSEIGNQVMAVGEMPIIQSIFSGNNGRSIF